MPGIPVAGYPSKKRAIIAMGEQGKSIEEIIIATDSTAQHVSTVLSQARARPKATTGWTDAKVAKASRLYPRILAEVAEALSVPAIELEQLWRTGGLNRAVVAPADFTAEIRADAAAVDAEIDRLSEPEKPQPKVEPVQVHRQLPPKIAPFQPKVEVDAKYRLKDDASGKYLHESCSTLTSDPRYAWLQPFDKIERVRQKFHIAKNLTPEKHIRIVR